MVKLYCVFVAFFTFFVGFSQNTVTLKGRAVDKIQNIPLEAATVYLSNAADSTLVDYTITDKNGAFVLNTKKTAKPVFLRVSFIGYQDYKQNISGISSDKDFGTLALSEDANVLDEVVIKSEAPPIRIKNDTLEFNASSFKLRPDANVESLLKQLPGVEIDSDGKITVNGKEVNQILVNGKPFFDKDGKVALQNLPSELINKVQITDLKTKKEELAGIAAKSNEASINLTIDEDKNKGLFGKLMFGAGSDKRYESSLLVNYFKNKRKISVLASSNNINAMGFSMNEIFDSMGGGRNNSYYSFGDGSFGFNGMQFGGSGKGITKSNMLGANYADEWFDGFDSTFSYFYTSSNTENVNRTRQENLLPDGKFITESTAKTVDDRFSNNFSSEFEYKIDSTATITFAPKFIQASAKFRQNSDQTSTDESGTILNKSTGKTFDETENTNFKSEIYFDKAFRRKGRAVSASFSNDNKKDDQTNLNITNTTFYEDVDNDGIPNAREDNRNQTRYNRNIRDEYAFQIEYREPIQDSLIVNVTVDYKRVSNSESRNAFNFDPVLEQYSDLNDSLTNSMFSRTNTFTPSVGISWERKKVRYGANFGSAITDLDIRSAQLGNSFAQTKQYILPEVNLYANYKFSKSKSIWISYNFDSNFPTVSQLAPIVDYSNPLNTIVGNPDVAPTKYHNIYMSFRNYDYATKSGYSFYAGGNYFDSQPVASTVYDVSRKRITTYENIAGSYNTWLGGNWSKSYKKEAHSYKYAIGINSGLTRSKGFTNSDLFIANSLRLTPKVSFTYDYGELVSINPSYSFTYSDTNYENYVIDRANTVQHKLNLQTTSYWPKHVVFGNDFGYTYNSNIANGFKKDFYLWNTSLGYNFLSDKLLAKVKVYDVLNQNLATSRTISSTSIRDEQNIILKRYVMFSLTYKVEKFGGKKKKSDVSFY